MQILRLYISHMENMDLLPKIFTNNLLPFRQQANNGEKDAVMRTPYEPYSGGYAQIKNDLNNSQNRVCAGENYCHSGEEVDSSRPTSKPTPAGIKDADPSDDNFNRQLENFLLSEHEISFDEIRPGENVTNKTNAVAGIVNITAQNFIPVLNASAQIVLIGGGETPPEATKTHISENNILTNDAGTPLSEISHAAPTQSIAIAMTEPAHAASVLHAANLNGNNTTNNKTKFPGKPENLPAPAVNQKDSLPEWSHAPQVQTQDALAPATPLTGALNEISSQHQNENGGNAASGNKPVPQPTATMPQTVAPMMPDHNLTADANCDANQQAIIALPIIQNQISVADASGGMPLTQTPTPALITQANPVAPHSKISQDNAPSANIEIVGIPPISLGDQSASPAVAQTESAPSSGATGTPVNSNAGSQNFSQYLQTQPATGADTPLITSQTPDIQGNAHFAIASDRIETQRTTSETNLTRPQMQTQEPAPPVRELAIQISRHADAGINRFQMRLDPPELGRVEVRIEISSEGKLTAVISADRPETLDLLQRDSRALERSLMDAGVKTDSGALNFSLRGGRQDDGQMANQYNSSRDYGPEWLNDINETAEHSGQIMRFSDRAINIRV